jgi:hypothetical protein
MNIIVAGITLFGLTFSYSLLFHPRYYQDRVSSLAFNAFRWWSSHRNSYSQRREKCGFLIRYLKDSFFRVDGRDTSAITQNDRPGVRILHAFLSRVSPSQLSKCADILSHNGCCMGCAKCLENLEEQHLNISAPMATVMGNHMLQHTNGHKPNRHTRTILEGMIRGFLWTIDEFFNGASRPFDVTPQLDSFYNKHTQIHSSDVPFYLSPSDLVADSTPNHKSGFLLYIRYKGYGENVSRLKTFSVVTYLNYDDKCQFPPECPTTKATGSLRTARVLRAYMDDHWDVTEVCRELQGPMSDFHCTVPRFSVNRISIRFAMWCCKLFSLPSLRYMEINDSLYNTEDANFYSSEGNTLDSNSRSPMLRRSPALQNLTLSDLVPPSPPDPLANRLNNDDNESVDSYFALDDDEDGADDVDDEANGPDLERDTSSDVSTIFSVPSSLNLSPYADSSSISTPGIDLSSGIRIYTSNNKWYHV